MRPLVSDIIMSFVDEPPAVEPMLSAKAGPELIKSKCLKSIFLCIISIRLCIKLMYRKNYLKKLTITLSTWTQKFKIMEYRRAGMMVHW